jgi:formamidopyrimidine-DNA glycosylase
MPELPEVETVRMGLSKYLPGTTIMAVDFDWPRGFPNDPTQVQKYLIGSTVREVKRRAKVLLIELSTNYTLVIHLKMTGQLVYRAGDGERWGAGHPNDSLIGELPDKSTRVTFDLAQGERTAKLFFNDQRKFGWVKLIPTPEVMQIDFFKRVGPEPLGPDFTLAEFRRRLARRAKTTIKAAILDQSVVAGVGNIYADESLHMAKIHPSSKVADVPAAKITKLHEAIRYFLQLSIDHGGSSDKNYVDADGNKGSYLKFAQVFRREGQDCPVCGSVIEKIRVAGRGTHVCPKCQKLAKP